MIQRVHSARLPNSKSRANPVCNDSERQITQDCLLCCLKQLSCSKSKEQPEKAIFLRENEHKPVPAALEATHGTDVGPGFWRTNQSGGAAGPKALAWPGSRPLIFTLRLNRGQSAAVMLTPLLQP
jgi:hypothetical protein